MILPNLYLVMHLLRLCLLHLGGVVVTFLPLALDHSQKALSQAERFDAQHLHLIYCHLEDVVNGDSFLEKDLKKLLESVPLKELLHPHSLVVGKTQLKCLLPLDWYDRHDRLEHLHLLASLEHVVGDLLERRARLVKVAVELFEVMNDLVRLILKDAVGHYHLQVFAHHREHELHRCLPG